MTEPVLMSVDIIVSGKKQENSSYKPTSSAEIAKAKGS
ncbi:hypothetical protein SpAn4DRAFT_4447 [Sporomusa ovata]|uniref:Uncharacterized protein n=1 Tax=Sporomusa ovata TaxID=2378 RepID=A0A0U1L7H5_9FIRM|nr:hypothetical protein SpAn4DRAFT_4447 [Sporomusa ovata]